MRAQSLQSCPTLCDLMDDSPPGFSVYGILQARIQERVAMPSSRKSSRPGDRTCISRIFCIAGRLFATETLGKPIGIYTLAYSFLFWFPCQDIGSTRAGTLSTVLSPMSNISQALVGIFGKNEDKQIYDSSPVSQAKPPLWSPIWAYLLGIFLSQEPQREVMQKMGSDVEDGVWGFDTKSRLNNISYHLPRVQVGVTVQKPGEWQMVNWEGRVNFREHKT